MAAAGIDLKILVALATAVVAIELLAVLFGTSLSAHSLITTGAARSCQILVIVLVLFAADGNLSAIGIRLASLKRGLQRGLIWSVGFGLVAALAAVFIYSAGTDPFSLIRSRLPANAVHIFLLFAVGGVIGPMAEEVIFRGLLYGYFRRWGVVPALLISTGIFVLIHLLARPVPGFAITQAIGGVVFAVSNELEKNLMVPRTIHCLGNMAIFTIPLFV